MSGAVVSRDVADLLAGLDVGSIHELAALVAEARAPHLPLPDARDLELVHSTLRRRLDAGRDAILVRRRIATIIERLEEIHA